VRLLCTLLSTGPSLLEAVAATAALLPYSDAVALAVASTALAITGMVRTADASSSTTAAAVQSVVHSAAAALGAVVTAATAAAAAAAADSAASTTSGATAAAVVGAVDAAVGLCGGDCVDSSSLQSTFQKAVGLTGASLMVGEPPFFYELPNSRCHYY
jgi:hypothetical protein